MPVVVQKFNSIQYDGTNGAEIVGVSSSWTLVSDNGTTLVFTDVESQWTLTVGFWLLWSGSNPDFPGQKLSNTDYLAFFQETPPALALGSGYALTPSIAGSGGTANVAVDLNTSMSGTGYEATAVLAGTSALLADLDITAVAITDNNTVTVTVQNNGALALAGATVIVTAGELV
jgi:hypothetical protein